MQRMSEDEDPNYEEIAIVDSGPQRVEPRQLRCRPSPEPPLRREDSSQQGDKSWSRRSRTKQITVPVADQLSAEDCEKVRNLLEEPVWHQSKPTLDVTKIKRFHEGSNEPALISPLAGKLLDLQRRVMDGGGIIHCLSTNLFKEVVTRFRLDWQLKTEDLRPYMLLYVRYLLKAELESKGFKQTTYCPVNLGYSDFWDSLKFSSWKKDHPEVWQLDLFVLQNFDTHSQLEQRCFTPDYLQNHFGKFIAETRLQNPRVLAFKSDQLWNQKSNRSISDYIDYQKAYQEQAGNNCQPMVEFAVNIEVTALENINYILRKSMNCVEELQYLSEFDGLSYLDSTIDGCNAPQMYIKVKGCWTGGHQENVSLGSVNLNHGPGQSEWLALADEHVPRLRLEVKKEFNIDIHKEEGLWFPDIYWFMMRNYPIKRIVQKKGDLVYSGPGTLHWVRAHGSCIQTAWNIMPKSIRQFESSKRRIDINESLRFPHMVIPFKSLALKILNHEYYKNPATARLEDFIWEWYNEENFNFNTVAKRYPYLQASHFELCDSQTYCVECKKEILLYYGYEDGNLMCVKCVKNVQRVPVYTKNRSCDIQELLRRCKAWREQKICYEIPEVLELCNGIFSGVVSFCYLIKARHVNDNRLVIDTTLNKSRLSLSRVKLRNSATLDMKLDLATSIKPSTIDLEALPSLVFDEAPKGTVSLRPNKDMQPKLEPENNPKNPLKASAVVGKSQIPKTILVKPANLPETKSVKSITPSPDYVKQAARKQDKKGGKGSPKSRSRNKPQRDSIPSIADSEISDYKPVKRGNNKKPAPTPTPAPAKPIAVVNAEKPQEPQEVVIKNVNPKRRAANTRQRQPEPSEKELPPAAKKAPKQTKKQGKKNERSDSMGSIKELSPLNEGTLVADKHVSTIAPSNVPLGRGARRAGQRENALMPEANMKKASILGSTVSAENNIRNISPHQTIVEVQPVLEPPKGAMQHPPTKSIEAAKSKPAKETKAARKPPTRRK